jgi:hypothetical protein
VVAADVADEDDAEFVAEAAAFAVLVEEVTCIGVVISGKRMEHRRTSLGFV